MSSTLDLLLADILKTKLENEKTEGNNKRSLIAADADNIFYTMGAERKKSDLLEESVCAYGRLDSVVEIWTEN